MISNLFRTIAYAGDASLAPAWLRILPQVPGLLIFAFHSLFESEPEAHQGLLDPQQAVTTAMFRAFVSDFIEHGYRFISPDHLAHVLDTPAACIMITFDDGYANHLRALPVLEEFGVPAVFFISPNFIVTGKPFWWDVLYREAGKQHWPMQKLNRERARLKLLRTREAEEQVVTEFGRPAFRTESSLDRPLNLRELADLTRHPLVHIGNHTWDHAILTNYTTHESCEQIQRAQVSLHAITGRAPKAIAYPNGNVSNAIIEAATDAGLSLGMTVHPGRNRISKLSSATTNMQLRRYTLRGDRDIATQCCVARSPLSLQSAMISIRSKLTAVA